MEGGHHCSNTPSQKSGRGLGNEYIRAKANLSIPVSIFASSLIIISLFFSLHRAATGGYLETHKHTLNQSMAHFFPSITHCISGIITSLNSFSTRWIFLLTHPTTCMKTPQSPLSSAVLITNKDEGAGKGGGEC